MPLLLPTVDRRLLAEAFRQLRVLMVPAEARELDLVIAILEDPDQEPTQGVVTEQGRAETDGDDNITFQVLVLRFPQQSTVPSAA
jgi:hypothetical protein